MTARGIRVDPSHLAAYCALAGKTATEAQPGVALLPLSYLECVLFPLFIEVGVHRASPFGLLGSVHLRNSITMVGRIPSGGVLLLLAFLAVVLASLLVAGGYRALLVHHHHRLINSLTGARTHRCSTAQSGATRS